METAAPGSVARLEDSDTVRTRLKWAYNDCLDDVDDSRDSQRPREATVLSPIFHERLAGGGHVCIRTQVRRYHLGFSSLGIYVRKGILRRIMLDVSGHLKVGGGK